MKNQHKKIIKTVADWLVSKGQRGRADHIGAHPFQDERTRLLTGRVRPDLKFHTAQLKVAIEVELTTPLRERGLYTRIEALMAQGYVCFIITHKKHIESLRLAFELNNHTRVPMIGTLKSILAAIDVLLRLTG